MKTQRGEEIEVRLFTYEGVDYVVVEVEECDSVCVATLTLNEATQLRDTLTAMVTALGGTS
jgi:hypothetical protein